MKIASAMSIGLMLMSAALATAQPQPPPGLQPFRKGLPPAPKLPPKAPPSIQGWLPPFAPVPMQRAPSNWFPIELVPYERLLVQPALARVPNLDGIWYMNGDPGKPTRIVQWRLDGRAMFVNEKGSQAWGSVSADSVWIPEWSDGFQQGLTGAIRGNQIIWPDRNFWSRTPVNAWPWDR